MRRSLTSATVSEMVLSFLLRSMIDVSPLQPVAVINSVMISTRPKPRLSLRLTLILPSVVVNQWFMVMLLI